MTNKTPEQLINELAAEEIEKHGNFVATWVIERLGHELDFSQTETVAIINLVIDDHSLLYSTKMSLQLQELMKCDPRVRFLMDMAFLIEEKVSGEKEKQEILC